MSQDPSEDMVGIPDSCISIPANQLSLDYGNANHLSRQHMCCSDVMIATQHGAISDAINCDTAVGNPFGGYQTENHSVYPVGARLNSSRDSGSIHDEAGESVDNSGSSNSHSSITEEDSTSSSNEENEHDILYVIQTPFRDWAEFHKKWIYLYLRRGLEEAVMDDILKTAGIGYKSWKTVVSNLCKDTGLSEAVKAYAVCPGHMCYVRDPNADDDQATLRCSVCDRPEPDILDRASLRMNYIPLLPRIRAMVRDESKCNALFSYIRNPVRKAGWRLDFFDGKLYERIRNDLAGEGQAYDIFIAASTDGFEVFQKGTCDIWPVAAIIQNLPPNLRFKMQNVLPFSFVPGSREPKNLQSFILPLIYELENINSNAGTKMIFPDGHMRKVRVHLLWFTGDLPAVAKVAGLVGHNGKMPCRFCLQPGVYLSSSNHYYYPSRILRQDPQTSAASSSSSGLEVICDLRSSNRRTEEHSHGVVSRLKVTTGRVKEALQRESGIREDSVLLRLPTMHRYISFPVDTMHLLYNVSRRMLEEIVLSREEPYALTRATIGRIDEEIRNSGINISSQLGSRPRPISRFKDWKASEHKDFVLSYSLVFFDGNLPEPFLTGWAKFVALSDVCYRSSLAEQDIEDAHRLAIDFLEHFEQHYYRYEESRLGLCKYVFHLLKHVAENMDNCGPLLNCSQLWVERYIGWIEHRLHARNLSSESLFRNALHAEACKMFFNEPFHEDDEDPELIESLDGVQFLGPHEKVTSHNQEETSVFERLLVDYFCRKYEGMTADGARLLVSAVDELQASARVKFLCGSQKIIAGSYNAYKHTVGSGSRRRANWFVATEMDEDGDSADVYYGRLLRVYSFRIEGNNSYHAVSQWKSWQSHYKVGMFDWVTGLMVGKHGQIFKNTETANAFTAPSLEDVSIIRRLISVVDHMLPSQTHGIFVTGAQSSTRGGRKRCYFLDGMVAKDHLLQENEPSEDGIDRNLRRILRRLDR